jgi:type II restriction-modification system restriction subunit
MNQLRITQYSHYPNTTELGQGNTHETYLLIPREVDLSEMFPMGIEVKILDNSTKKTYTLKSAIGREFRVNQMGDIYRDYNVMPGDEIVFTMISSSQGTNIYLQVKCYTRVVFCVSEKGCEISNISRLNNFKSGDAYRLQIKHSDGLKNVRIALSGSQKKRSDSPTETDFYEVSVDEKPLSKGQYLLDLGQENTLRSYTKWKFATTEIDGSLLNEVSKPSLGLERRACPILTQVIYFGTPGSGKSHKVQQSLEGVPEECVFRTTFHPDSDYASFVGCYKPIVRQLLGRTALSKEELKAKLMEYKQTKDGQHPLHRFCAAHPEFANLSGDDKKEILASAGEPDSKYVETYKAIACADELRKYMTDSDITYEFTPQVFTNAYVQAWKLQTEASEQAPAQAVYLVIEEINRGNCAQIFGDLFQLLDRNEEGFSTYKIRADKDLTMYLQKELGKGHEGIDGGNLRLPANLHIIATMNTSDQSLFPMDSAFKRRWDWEYVPIDYGEEIASGKFEISIGDKKYRWIDFLKVVNKRILESTDSEDKQMGNFFIKQSVDEKVFKSKVMSYLWHEVCKDEYHTKNNFFRINQEKGEKEFTFNELHEENGTNLLIGFMQYLGVKAQEDDPSQAENRGTPNADEEGVEES